MEHRIAMIVHPRAGATCERDGERKKNGKRAAETSKANRIWWSAGKRATATAPDNPSLCGDFFKAQRRVVDGRTSGTARGSHFCCSRSSDRNHDRHLFLFELRKIGNLTRATIHL
ncbi:hypothetical protein PUN28_004345 [Cardiocondyla obscurior]|uniref:Uncharacterized protein n=1 Tax=Cardiocondyla obscurior TaxID=286306 RepID=A0AAW2GA99_9HYME